MSNTILILALVVVAVALIYGIWSFAKQYHIRRAMINLDEMSIKEAPEDATEHTLELEKHVVAVPGVRIVVSDDKTPTEAPIKNTNKRVAKKTADKPKKTQGAKVTRENEIPETTGVAKKKTVKAKKAVAPAIINDSLPSIDKDLDKPAPKRGRKKSAK